MMQTVINYFMDSPTLLIAIIVFIFCVIIGFFGERYLKKTGGINKTMDSKPEDDAKDEQKVVKETEKVTSQADVDNDLKENDLVNDNLSEDFMPDNIYPSQNEPQSININQNTNFSQDIDVPYINNDDNFNNMF